MVYWSSRHSQQSKKKACPHALSPHSFLLYVLQCCSTAHHEHDDVDDDDVDVDVRGCSHITQDRGKND